MKWNKTSCFESELPPAHEPVMLSVLNEEGEPRTYIGTYTPTRYGRVGWTWYDHELRAYRDSGNVERPGRIVTHWAPLPDREQTPLEAFESKILALTSEAHQHGFRMTVELGKL